MHVQLEETVTQHTHYSPYEPPRQVPGTLLDCTPEYPLYHRVEGSELAADYMYSPRFGLPSITGLPPVVLLDLTEAYLAHRSTDTQWVIADVVADEA